MEGVVLVECANPVDAVPMVRAQGRAVMLCHASTQDHIVKIVTMLKLLRESGISQGTRILATIRFEASGADVIAEKLRLYGVTEVLLEPTQSRSLVFKLERYVRSLPSTETLTRKRGKDGRQRMAPDLSVKR